MNDPRIHDIAGYVTIALVALREKDIEEAVAALRAAYVGLKHLDSALHGG